MKMLLGVVFDFLLVIFGMIFSSVILTSLFIGSGYIISLLYKFTLFNAIALSVGATFVSAFIIFIAIYTRYEDGRRNDLDMENNDCDCSVCTSRRKKLENKKLRRHKF